MLSWQESQHIPSKLSIILFTCSSVIRQLSSSISVKLPSFENSSISGSKIPIKAWFYNTYTTLVLSDCLATAVV